MVSLGHLSTSIVVVLGFKLPLWLDYNSQVSFASIDKLPTASVAGVIFTGGGDIGSDDRDFIAFGVVSGHSVFLL